VDKGDAIMGVVTVLGRDLAEEMLKMGLARTVGWAGVRENAKYHEKLAAAQDIAVKQKLKLWEKGGPAGPAAATVREGEANKIVGKVVDIPSAGIIVVAEDGPSGKHHRIMLASIRAPRLYREEPKTIAAKGKKGKGKGAGASEGVPKSQAPEGPSKKQLLDNMLAMTGREYLRKRLFGLPVTCMRRYDRSG
jgi:hypothetical protein